MKGEESLSGSADGILFGQVKAVEGGGRRCVISQRSKVLTCLDAIEFASGLENVWRELGSSLFSMD